MQPPQRSSSEGILVSERRSPTPYQIKFSEVEYHRGHAAVLQNQENGRVLGSMVIREVFYGLQRASMRNVRASSKEATHEDGYKDRD